ncbi:MAG: hypothetical protein O2973_03750 [Gemmatimonadetes bacterium]|nr:hypothetical protein [Gemmatimonadota bacterium]
MVEHGHVSANSRSAAASLAGSRVVECPLSPRWKRFSKRAAQVGFAFFLLKGIAWIVVAILAWRGLA